jgi:hypothetical protein
MIDNNHELTTGELDAVSGGESGLMGGSGVMGMLNQIMQTIQKTQNPAPPRRKAARTRSSKQSIVWGDGRADLPSPVVLRPHNGFRGRLSWRPLSLQIEFSGRGRIRTDDRAKPHGRL